MKEYIVSQEYIDGIYEYEGITYGLEQNEELIRCKDCKYYLKSNEVCQLINTRLHFFATDKKWLDDSFCSWAERKEEKNEKRD